MLSRNPNDVDAWRQIASIDRSTMNFDKSREDELKIIQLDPKDAEANYAVGALDWQKADKNSQDLLQANHLTRDAQGVVKFPPKVCAQLAAENGPLLDSVDAVPEPRGRSEGQLRRRHVVPQPRLAP